ncbi:MAG TPA: hypothetical protein VM452_07240 [Caulifigura sp.]|nr:hypothetical protein [Caulifigura sp.]
MKTTLIAAFSAIALGFAATAEAQVPCNTGYGTWGNSTSYYAPVTSGYSTNYGYGVSQPYVGYPSAPQYGTVPYVAPRYGSTWNNTSVYRAPTYTYDPVHGDFHRNTSYSTNRWNNGFGHTYPHHRNW